MLVSIPVCRRRSRLADRLLKLPENPGGSAASEERSRPAAQIGLTDRLTLWDRVGDIGVLVRGPLSGCLLSQCRRSVAHEYWSRASFELDKFYMLAQSLLPTEPRLGSDRYVLLNHRYLRSDPSGVKGRLLLAFLLPDRRAKSRLRK